MENLESLQTALAKALVNRGGSPHSDHRSSLDVLDQIHRDELNRSRETLFRKRFSQIRDLLPKTASALGRRFEPLVTDHIHSTHFDGLFAIQSDAVAFSKRVASAKETPCWLVDLTNWEAWHWSLMLRSRAIEWKFFRSPVWAWNPEINWNGGAPRCVSLWMGYRWNQYLHRQLIFDFLFDSTAKKLFRYRRIG